MQETSPATAIFDRIGLLKAQAALALGFDRDQRCAATSPGPAFPTVLRTLAGQVPRRDGAVIVDLGAGLGGVSTWLATQTGAQVIAVEPAPGARAAAHALFPDLDIRAGAAEHSGLGDAIADAVVLSGVISLIDDLSALLGEVRRLLRPGGVLGVADMFLDGHGVERSGVNTLRSLHAATDALVRAGFEVTAVGCARDANPDEAWQRRADELQDWLLRHHHDDPAVREWMADQDQLTAWMDGDHVFGACVVGRIAVASDGPVASAGPATSAGSAAPTTT
ncbi:MAG: Methyltransferase type 11 [Ilumatobacteraceae bacterium]|nr:Methyltransferase type 11 [Ilumatobacteraceae bacterium]